MPLDLNTLTALKRCALGLKSPLRLSWRQLYRQFDANPAKVPDKRAVQNFRIKVLRELVKIKLAWPGLNYATAPGVLILLPSTPATRTGNPGKGTQNGV